MVFLPTRGAHYRTPPVASVEDRLAMLRVALAPNPAFGLDESDLDPEATGYTADLMPRVRARYPDDRLTFVVGGDSLVDSPWQRFETVLANLDGFAVAPRAQREPQRLDAFLASLPDGERGKAVVLDLPALNGSATLVRAQLARGGSVRYLLPDAVARYITRRGLYAGASHADG
jgi:nicotinate-nucleotide adenylyltransferase